MPHQRAVAAAIAACLALGSSRASAFVLKQCEGGAAVRWRRDQVEFTLHRSLDAVAGASTAARAAAAAWSGKAGAPSASVVAGSAPASPAVDGKNVILRSASFAPVGAALAVTVLSFEEFSGDIVDADIVLSAKHDLEVLPRAAAKPVSAGEQEDEDEDEGSGKSGSSSSGSGQASRPKDAHSLSDDGAKYDVAWVLAHEMGHAMGLGDDPSAPDALMYPYVTPDVAGPAAPTRADLDGIEALYEGAGATAAASPDAAAGGCSGATVAARGLGGASGRSARYGGAIVLGMVALGLARRRRKGAALAGMLAFWCVTPSVSSRATGAVRAMDAEAEVFARVTDARASRGEDGITRTDLRLVVAGSRVLPVAAATVLRTAVRGGTYGGIRQQVGRQIVPAGGAEVRVVLRKAALPSAFRLGGALAGSASNDIVVRTKGR